MEAKLAELLKSIKPETHEEFSRQFREIYGKEIKVPVTTDDLTPITYVAGNKTPQTHLHIGQLKLILSEIQFLTGKTPGICIYAGAAPSHKGALLACMFPEIKFLLVDPREFAIVKFNGVTEVDLLPADTEMDPSPETCRRILTETMSGSGNLFTACSMFTETFARAVAELVPPTGLYFISDIRTSPDGVMPADIDIVDNNAQMATWIHIMNPAASLLKFRHPFYDDVDRMVADARSESYSARLMVAKIVTGIDFIADAAEKRLIYPPGQIYLQAFAPKSSTETRLMVTRPREKTDHGTANHYDSMLFTWNSLMRSYGYFYNPDAAPEIGFDHCGDCALMGKICRDWIKNHTSVATRLGIRSVRRLVEMLLKWSGEHHARTLKSGTHGIIYTPPKI